MEKIKILLVEDDTNLGFVIQDGLQLKGFDVTLKTDGKEGLIAFSEKQFNLCLLDVMLPKKDGFSLAEDIKKIEPNVPIVFLTAKSMTEDKIKGFKAGADDYITKPFSMDELELRIMAILKRSGMGEEKSDEFNFGSYLFNSKSYDLYFKNDLVKRLTKKEAKILTILLEHQNQVVEREIILNLVWGDDSYFNGRSLDVFITKLRKYLSQDNHFSIKNIHGIGFTLESN